MPIKTKGSESHSHRTGLAPLEFVLSLPILLFVAALMVNFADVARWKIRTQINARHAAWRTLRPRTGGENPPPPNWPSSANLTQGSGANLDGAGAVWKAVPDLNNEVMTGPAGRIRDPQSGRVIRVRRQLEIGRGVHRGTARIERRLHQLRRILPDGGRYQFRLEQPLLDNPWPFHMLGFGGNRARRAKQWYQLNPDNFPQLRPQIQRLERAHRRLKANPLKDDLDPLDRDGEFIVFTGRAPDFHPAIGGCASNFQAYRNDEVASLRRRIRQLPRRMAGEFQSLYRQQINRLRQMDPPPDDAAVTIRRLRDKINQLNRFQDLLSRRD